MSYNSNYRNYTGPMYVVAAVLAGLVLFANLFTLQTIFSMFGSISYYGSGFYSFLYVLICLLSLAELGLMLAFSIGVFARAANETLGKIEIATAIVTGIDITIRFIMAHGYIGVTSVINYAFLIGYQICLAIVIRTRKDVIRKIWFIPGIVAGSSVLYDIVAFPGTFSYGFAGFNSFMTIILKPIVTIAFAFCLMKWAADRIQDKKAVPQTVTAAPVISKSPVTSPAETGMTITCPKCGRKLQSYEKFCSTCGTKVQEGYCYSCGSPLIAGNAFCNKCGAKVVN